MEDVARMRKYFETDALAKLLGMEMLDVAPGRATVRMEVRPEHLNTFGTAHGGTIFALADYAFEVAGNSHGTVAVALNVDISFLKAVGLETITAEAKEVSAGNRVRHYDITVTNADGEAVAFFHGIVYRKRDEIAWPE
jgi:acyl-CoA thioesterase